MKFIPVYEPLISKRARSYAISAIDSTWISSKGEFLPRFEEEFCKFTGIKSSTVCSNGTVALHLAFLALGIKPGHEAIVPTFTYVASVNAIAFSGLKPVFIDSLPDTLQMDPSKIEPAITGNTKVIIVPHLYGFSCNMEQIMQIARKYKLFVIEDCAEALGTFYKKEHVGTFGDISTFSFFGNKTITTGEGGMVASNDSLLVKKAVHFKGQGLESLNPLKTSSREYWHDVIGYNYRMTNIQAAFGLAGMEEIEETLARKKKIAEIYSNNIKKGKIVYEIKDVISTYWMVVIMFENSKDALKAREALKKGNVETRPLFPPVHTMPMYNTGEHFEIAQDTAFRGINVPSFPSLKEEQILYICDIINSI